jgi:hypothetical protein
MHQLAPELLPGGCYKNGGRVWRCDDLGGGEGGSLKVELVGDKAGLWLDFASGERGDALSLVAAVLFGGDIREAIKWGRDYLRHAASVPRRARPKPRPAPTEAERRRRAEEIWLRTQPLEPGDMVDRYLLSRGISLAELVARCGHKLPGSFPLRFHPTGLLEPESGMSCPAMVAAIVGPDGARSAVHVTWLTALADGKIVKAPLKSAKKTFGSPGAGAIRLWGPDWPSAMEGDVLAISEGIEDALSAAVLLSREEVSRKVGKRVEKLRFCAARSLGGIMSMAVPREFQHIIIVKQNDLDSRPVELLRKVRARFRASRKVYLYGPQSPDKKDVNEVLQARMRR